MVYVLTTMDRNMMLLVFSGLCIFASCSQIYHIVTTKMTWSNAQSYCRDKHTDLVTVNSEQDMARLSQIVSDSEEVWIGLYGDFNNWKWSLQREGFYADGQMEFRLWYAGQPNAYTGTSVCVNIASFGEWSDNWCSSALPFVCYNDLSETRYVYVSSPMAWTTAQQYCRKYYTDLASVRNQSENDEVKKLVENFAWIGLYRESWKWSDGQQQHMNSFGSWNQNQPDRIVQACVTSLYSKWTSRLCSATYAFVCSEDAVRKQVVKMVLAKPDSSVDLEQMQDSMLQQFRLRLRHLDDELGENITLEWIKQPDGKIFMRETEKEDIEQDAEGRGCIK